MDGRFRRPGGAAPHPRPRRLQQDVLFLGRRPPTRPHLRAPQGVRERHQRQAEEEDAKGGARGHPDPPRAVDTGAY